MTPEELERLARVVSGDVTGNGDMTRNGPLTTDIVDRSQRPSFSDYYSDDELERMRNIAAYEEERRNSIVNTAPYLDEQGRALPQEEVANRIGGMATPMDPAQAQPSVVAPQSSIAEPQPSDRGMRIAEFLSGPPTFTPSYATGPGGGFLGGSTQETEMLQAQPTAPSQTASLFADRPIGGGAFLPGGEQNQPREQLGELRGIARAQGATGSESLFMARQMAQEQQAAQAAQALRQQAAQADQQLAERSLELREQQAEQPRLTRTEEDLQGLKRMREAGDISDDEYESMRKRLIGVDDSGQGAGSAIQQLLQTAGGESGGTPTKFQVGERRRQGGVVYQFDGTNWNPVG